MFLSLISKFLHINSYFYLINNFLDILINKFNYRNGKVGKISFPNLNIIY